MFFYFARLYQKYLQRVYPIVIFSFDEPRRPEPHQHTIAFPDWKVLEFNFRTIQLNRLHWRDYLSQRNPVAAALMAKMQIAPGDRPKVKVECLRLLTTLRLDPARTRLISGFVDTYLQLNSQETQVFQSEMSRLEPREQEAAMEIVTSWKREGIEEGIEQGEQAKQMEILKRMLAENLPIDLMARITGLSIEQIQQIISE